MKIISSALFLLASLMVILPASAVTSLPVVSDGDVVEMTAMADDEMGGVIAQGLILTDKITGSELAGSNAYSTPFTFYRMGLDGELGLNLNVAKLQLGCGGINDFLTHVQGCDIDLDYVSLMGKNAAGDGPGAPLSDFKLVRPYIEVAVKNDGNPSRREVVGIKIGAQSADGAISVGRKYANGATNQENAYIKDFSNSLSGGTNRPDNVCTGEAIGGGALGCHSGINSVSGFLGAEMSLQMRVIACIRVIFCVDLDAWGCIGKLTAPNCSTYPNTPLYVDVAGTRMQTLSLKAAKLDLSGNGGLSSLFTALVANAYASLDADLRLVHKLVFDNTGDFFLSFQREPVAYPRYNKLAPASDAAVVNDGCKTTNFASARCSSAYAVPANTGWWLNAPSVKLINVTNNNADLGDVSIGQALTLLAAPGPTIYQGEFQLTPSQNCRGTKRFC